VIAACSARPNEGETDAQVHWFRVRGLLTRNLHLDNRLGRRPRLAKISHVGDGFAGRMFYIYGDALAKILTEKLGSAECWPTRFQNWQRSCG
jgi:hypothetical protein